MFGNLGMLVPFFVLLLLSSLKEGETEPCSLFFPGYHISCLLAEFWQKKRQKEKKKDTGRRLNRVGEWSPGLLLLLLLKQLLSSCFFSVAPDPWFHLMTFSAVISLHVSSFQPTDGSGFQLFNFRLPYHILYESQKLHYLCNNFPELNSLCRKVIT